LQYDQVTNAGTAFTRLNATWSDEYHTNANMTDAEVQDSYTMFNLRSGLRFGDKEGRYC
jgi:hypothetical protein